MVEGAEEGEESIDPIQGIIDAVLAASGEIARAFGEFCGILTGSDIIDAPGDPPVEVSEEIGKHGRVVAMFRLQRVCNVIALEQPEGDHGWRIPWMACWQS